jgi:hypothetical protein
LGGLSLINGVIDGSSRSVLYFTFQGEPYDKTVYVFNDNNWQNGLQSVTIAGKPLNPSSSVLGPLAAIDPQTGSVLMSWAGLEGNAYLAADNSGVDFGTPFCFTTVGAASMAPAGVLRNGPLLAIVNSFGSMVMTENLQEGSWSPAVSFPPFPNLDSGSSAAVAVCNQASFVARVDTGGNLQFVLL